MWPILAIAITAGTQSAGADKWLVINEPLRPTEVVKAVTGNCGSNTYRIELRSNGQRNILSGQVNGRAIPQAEMAKVTTYLPNSYFMFEPNVAECYRDRPSARVTLLVTEFKGPKAEGLSFEVTQDRKITAVRRD